MPEQIVIVGAGQAGGWAAKTLRDCGFTGSIVLVADEGHPPYERPPLSKAVLTGAKPPESCYLWPRDRLRELQIDFEPGVAAVSVDRDRSVVRLSNGRHVRYDRLLLATGARPRRLRCRGADLPGVNYLRTIQDSVAVGQAIEPGRRLLVIGGGWIGLEVAASAMSKGVAVTLIEASDRLCGRVLPRQLGSYFLDLHKAHGVDVQLNVGLAYFEGRGRLERACFTDGTEFEVSAAVVGIGVEPNVELARDCGLRLANGIVVDGRGCTDDPNIFAAGDVACQALPGVAQPIRLESWKNAQDQGIAVAKAMLGQHVASREIPWFWSDQYDVNFQMLGIPSTHSVAYQKGEASSGSFVHYFVDDGRLTAVAAVNSSRELREAKRVMASQQPFRADALTGLVCLN